VNKQSNLKITKQLKLQCRICPASGQICPVNRNFVQRKSRSGAKTMRLGPDELTISRLDNMELREINGTNRSKLNSRIQIYG
jgi:hypothetical protein